MVLDLASSPLTLALDGLAQWPLTNLSVLFALTPHSGPGPLQMLLPVWKTLVLSPFT